MLHMSKKKKKRRRMQVNHLLNVNTLDIWSNFIFNFEQAS